jgi:hypothetical protein
MTPFPREGLRSWFVSITGLPSAAIVFDDKPEAFTTATARLRIALTSEEQAAVEDEWAQAASPAPDGAATVTTRELSYVTLGLTCELQAPAATNFPNDILRRIRTKCRQEAYLNGLNAIGLALVDHGNIRRINGRTSEGRVMPVAQLDLRVGFYVEDVVSPTEMATDFIKQTTAQIDLAEKPVTLTITAGAP